MRKFLSALVVASLAGAAWAGSPADQAKKMKDMQSEMAKCLICKPLAAKMDAIGPMAVDVVHLDNGVAMLHHVKDASKLPIYRAASAEMSKNAEAAMQLTDADAKTQLCPICQDIRAGILKGATISMGDTKTGDMMVLTSADPVVRKDLTAAATKCEMMMAGGAEKDPHAGHKH